MTDQLVSTGTTVALVIGLVIAAVYLYYGWGALKKSVRIRNEKEDGTPDKYRYSLIGAVISVIASIASIAIYGVGPALLYWGPILAMIAAVAVAFTLREEVVD